MCNDLAEAMKALDGKKEWSSFWIPRLNPLAATLQCTAGIVLRRRHSGTREAPEQFCRYFFSLAPSDSARLRNCWLLATQCFTDFAYCAELFSLSTWHRIHVYPVTNLVSGGPRLVTYLAICDRLCHSHGAAPRKGGGTIAIWPPTMHSPCS